MSIQLVCEYCSGPAFLEYQKALEKHPPMVYMRDVERDKSDPETANEYDERFRVTHRMKEQDRYLYRKWRHTPHEPLGLKQWRCKFCGTKRKYG